MTTSSARGLCALVVAALLCARGASADPAPREQALALLREGNQLFEARRYEAALARFERARKLYPSYKIHYNLAATHEALAQLALSATHFELYLLEAREREPAAAVTAAEGRLRAIAAKLARLRLSCAVVDAEVRVDGALAGRIPLPHPLYLPPGRHQLTVRKGARTLYARDLALVAGEHRLTVLPDGEPRPEATPTALALPPPPSAPPPGAPPVGEGPRPLYKRAWFWLAVTGVLVGVSAIVVATQVGGSDRMPIGTAGTIR